MWFLLLFVVCTKSQANLKCTELHCHKEADACFSDDLCLKLVACSSYCMETWDDDPTQQKVHAQNCTLKCSASFEDDISDEFMSCSLQHNCMTFPPINVSCPAHLSKYIQKNSSIADLSGEWWQHYGHNPLWDCYPCQHIHNMSQINASVWQYTYSYDIYLVNNSLEYFEQTWILPNPPNGITINITYDYMSTNHEESWFVLYSTDRFVVLVVCSYMYSWTNVGSIIWVRPNLTLTQQELKIIAQVYKDSLGWDFPQDFCKTQHGAQCKESNKKIKKLKTQKHFGAI